MTGRARSALVTGGTRGIGKAIAERLLADGWEVAVCGRTEPETPVASTDGRTAIFEAADIRSPEVATELVDRVAARFGGLDLLVNNAGGSPKADLADSSLRLIERVVALNLLAPLYVARAAQAVMRQQLDGGQIVNIASISGQRPSPGTAAYGAAKAGLISATGSLAMEWGPLVRVNAIVVGLVEAEGQEEHYGGAEGIAKLSATVPMARLARGADVAGAVAWLASPDAAYVTGASIQLHGGGERPAVSQIS